MRPAAKPSLLSIPARRFLACTLLLGLAACDRNEPADERAGRPVAVVTVEPGTLADYLRLSGEIEAEKNISLAFRIGGRLAERTVNVGDSVAAGQVIARLEPSLERNAVTAAKAALEAARGEVATTRSTFERQERLMSQGFTTRPLFDRAKQARDAAQAQFENAEAQLELAQDRLDFTELRSDVAGTVTARSAEPGEVVQPGQSIVQIARDDGRDAVFAVPAQLLEAKSSGISIKVALADAPAVTATGRIREISPQADPVTRTFQVRVGLDNPPEAMRLGATVVGSVQLTSAAIVSIPASALAQSGQSPAVWIVDPAKSTVALRNIDILRFDPGRVIVSQGLEAGETVVSGGIQALHPGQRVRALTGPPAAAGPASGRTPS